MSISETFSDLSLSASAEKRSTSFINDLPQPLKYLPQKYIEEEFSQNQSEDDFNFNQKSTHQHIDNNTHLEIDGVNKLPLENRKYYSAETHNQQQIKFINPSHIALTILQLFVFCCFLVGSIQNPTGFKYIDVVGNVICVIKIILSHVFLALFNRKQQMINHTQKKQQTTFYVNKLQSYQIFQIWSIMLTLLIFIFPYQLFQAILSSLRLLRLFFPFLADRSAKGKFNAKLFLHVFSIVFFIFITTVFLSFSLKFLLFRIDYYYCFSQTQLQFLTLSGSIPSQLQSCGLFSSCSTGQQCQSIFSFAENRQQTNSILQLFSLKEPTFSNNILYSMQAVLSGSSALYNQYQALFLNWLWFIIVIGIWLIYYIFTGIGIGQSINYDSLSEWKKTHQKENKKKSQIKKVVPHLKKQQIQNMNLNSSKPLRQTPRTDDNLIPMTRIPSLSEFSSHIQATENKFKSRGFLHKLVATLFNIICIIQVLLLIGDNVNFDSIPNRNIGIGIGVIYIIWTFGLGFAIYKYFTTEKQKRSTVYTNVLIYEGLAYFVMLTDYIFRIISGYLIFQYPTNATPFAYAIISLRVMEVLYNNGFDAYLSFYVEKMMLNFINNLPVLAFFLIVGFTIGFILSYINNSLSFQDQLQHVNTGISIVYGTDGFSMGSSLLSNLISTFIKFLAIMTNFYIAKHINIGYGQIIQIDFNQQPLILLNQQNQDENNKPINWFRSHLIALINNKFYKFFKIFIVLEYVALTLMFLGQNNLINIIVLVMDCYFIVDIVSQIIGYGIKGVGSYFSSDLFIKVSYIISQILCIIFFVVTTFPYEIKVAVRVTRSFIIFGCIDQLFYIYIAIKSIIFHPKVKIFKVFFIPPFLLLVGATLTSFYVGELSLNNYDKILTLLAFSMSYVYNLGWNFTTIQIQQTVYVLCLNLMFVSLILFVHVILTFMMVTFFLNIKGRNLGSPSLQIIKYYGSTNPQFYFHQPVIDKSTFRYINSIKIAIIMTAFILLAFLSGDLLQHSPLRIILVTINIVLFLVQICIYFIENILVRKKQNRWGKGEAFLLLLSAPGTFLMVASISKISAAFSLIILIRICLCFSTLRLLRIISIMKSRQSSIFSSTFIRRAQNLFNLKETLGIFIFVVLSILPFSVFEALRSGTNIPTQFLNFLTGSIFQSPSLTYSIEEIILKFICIFLVLFPLRILLLAKVISSFICNKPSELFMLRDEIGRALCQSNILQSNSTHLFLPYFNFYRLPAQIFKIFQQFSAKTPLKCLRYNKIMDQLASLNIPVYSYESYSQRGNAYGILFYDLIWYIFIILLGNQNEQSRNILSLYEKQESKPPQIAISHMGTLQLCSYLKIQQRMKERVKYMKSQMNQDQLKTKSIDQQRVSKIFDE